MLLPAVAVLFSGTCEKVPRPNSDSTSPTLEWVVTNDGTNEQQVFQGGGSINTAQGTTFTVTLKARDPEGVHEIRLGGSSQWSCQSGDIGQNVGPSLGSTDVQILNPDSEGNVLTEIFLLRDVEAGPYNCQSGFQLRGGTETLHGTGENYFSGVTQGTLTFHVAS